MKSNAPFQVGDQLEATIEKLTFNGGRGLCRPHGFVVFVPYVYPGEKTVIEITQIKKNYAVASLVEVLEPAENRVEPPCSVFYSCGGCDWQHITYPEQVKFKQQLLTEFVNKLKDSSEIKIEEFSACLQPWNYRNRIQVHKKSKKFGFFAKQSHKLTAIEQCPIAKEEINAYLPKLLDCPDGRYEIEISKNETVNIRQNLQPSERAFVQINSEQNSYLQGYITHLAANISPTRIVDLYAGAGNFSFKLSESCDVEVLAVELSSAAVSQAKNLVEQQNLQFIESSVEDFLEQKPILADDLVVVDPPRTGLSRASLRALTEQRAKDIIYISCNPATLVRDLEAFISVGYKPESIKGFDMFPQTAHIESVTHLRLSV